MCGIIGCVGCDDALDVLLTGLQNLEYRGYDSAGVAIADDAVAVRKREGKLDALTDATDGWTVNGSVGIGHTRWSTHGPPTDANSHPHTDCIGDVAVVHNGVLDNFQELRDELDADHEFDSDTDTEVVPHLIEDALADGLSPEDAFRRAIDRIDGSYAIAAVVAGADAIFATRHDSPLVLGVGDGSFYLGSDVPAFLDYTDRVVYLDDGDFVRLDADGWTVTDADGDPVDKSVETVDWEPEETGRSGYDHFMLKEIHEQPQALRQCIQGRVDGLRGDVSLPDVETLDGVDAVHLVACGTSYHAAMYAAQLFHVAGVPAQAFRASEYATSPPLSTEDTLVAGVTQSGETADTLSALREARKRGRRTLAVTNVVGSTAARECDDALYIRSGPEIGVAATKTFSSQVVALNLLASVLRELSGQGAVSREFIDALRELPDHAQQVLDETQAQVVAEEYLAADGYFFIGRGLNHPVALEGALKFKEITYEHAEGFAAGELKHGPLALVTRQTPVFAIVTGDDERARKTVGNVKEVEARDAPVIAVTDGQTEVERYADHVLRIPETDDRLAPVLANVQLQLIAYYVADALERSIDKPRNLAKSVTVE